MGKRRRGGRDLNGILLLDKSQGVTSNGALQMAKKMFAAAKAGHTGSLDPLATGMLPICFGEATKFSWTPTSATGSPPSWAWPRKPATRTARCVKPAR